MLGAVLRDKLEIQKYKERLKIPYTSLFRTYNNSFSKYYHCKTSLCVNFSKAAWASHWLFHLQFHRRCYIICVGLSCPTFSLSKISHIFFFLLHVRSGLDFRLPQETFTGQRKTSRKGLWGGQWVKRKGKCEGEREREDTTWWPIV